MMRPICSLAGSEDVASHNPGVPDEVRIPAYPGMLPRILEPTDTALMRRLVGLICREHNQHDGFEAPAPERFDPAAWLRQDHLLAVVILDAGELVGGLAAFEVHPLGYERGELHVSQLAIRAGQRRREVAAMLVRTLARAARDRGLGRIMLEVDLLDFHAIAPLLPPVERKDRMQFEIPVLQQSS